MSWIESQSLSWLSWLAYRDRLRTTTNVLGDSIGAGIVEFLSRNELRSKDVEMGNSVLEEKERKKPYKLISQDSDLENDRRAHLESNMWPTTATIPSE